MARSTGGTVLRRRSIGSAVGLGMGTLLKDEAAQRDESARAAAEAERAKAKQTSSIANQAKNIYQEYQSGNATFKDTMDALKALSDNGDAELKQILASYINNTSNTKTTRDINDKVDSYNNGTISYDDLVKFLGGVSTNNDVIKNAIAKDLTAARSAENTRVMNQANQDYQNGKITLDQYTSQMKDLRNQTGQGVNDLTKIDQAIDAARVTQERLNDAKTYAGWQSGSISAADALAYFSARAANAKTPQDVSDLSNYTNKIKSSADQSAKGAASAYQKSIDENASKDMKSFYDNVLLKAVGTGKNNDGTTDFGTCNGDPQCIISAYDAYGKKALQWSQMGGTLASAYKAESDRAGIAGALAAAQKYHDKILSDIADQRKQLSGEAGKNIDPVEKAGILAKIGELASNGEASAFLTDAQKADLKREREQAALEINGIGNQFSTDKGKQTSEVKMATTDLYDGLMKAKGDPNAQAATNKAYGPDSPLGLKLDGSDDDRNKFAQWLAADPTTRAQIIADSLGKGQLDPTTLAAILKASTSGSGLTTDNYDKILTAQIHTQFPTLNDAQVKLAVEQKASGVGFSSSKGVITAYQDDQRESAKFAAQQATFQQEQLGQFRTSTGPDGGTVISTHDPNVMITAGEDNGTTYGAGMKDSFGRTLGADGLPIGDEAQQALDARDKNAKDAFVQDLVDKANTPGYTAQTPGETNQGTVQDLVDQSNQPGYQVQTPGEDTQTTAGLPQADIPQFNLSNIDNGGATAIPTFNAVSDGGSNSLTAFDGSDVPQFTSNLNEINKNDGTGASSLPSGSTDNTISA